MARLRSGSGHPAEVRIRFLGDNGEQCTYTITAAFWQLSVDQEAIPLDANSWDHYGTSQQWQYVAGNQRATLRLEGIGKASPPPESLAVQMARAILEGDNAAAMALADAIVNNPEEAFACASS